MAKTLIVLLTAVVVLVFLIVKLNIHPVLAIFIGGIIAGIGFGYGVGGTITTFTEGFGATLGGIGCTIIFGSIIAQGIRDTGAIKSMVNFFIKLFKGKCMELSTALASYIMSIPVFGDITQVLTAPIASMIAKRDKKSMSTMAGFSILGSALTHALVPPTPGILAVSILLGADLGMVIAWGIVVTLIAFLVTWITCRKWVAKEQIEPREDYVRGIEEVDNSDYSNLLIIEEGLPGVLVSASPILVPVILIAASSFANMILHEGNVARTVMNAIGDKNIALFIGVIITFLIGAAKRTNVIKNYQECTGSNEDSIFKIMLNNWVGDALQVALLPLIITAMGGGFSAIIKSYPGMEALGDAIVKTSVPSMLIPAMIGMVMMIAVGSRTTAGMTAAAICVPMVSQLGLSAPAIAILIGCGTMIGSHVSDSGFWVGTSLFNLNTTQGLKYITVLGSISGVIAFITTAGFIGAGLL